MFPETVARKIRAAFPQEPKVLDEGDEAQIEALKLTEPQWSNGIETIIRECLARPWIFVVRLDGRIGLTKEARNILS